MVTFAVGWRAVLQSYSRLKTCRGRMTIAATLRHVCRWLDIYRSPMSHWAHLRCVVAVLSLAYSCSIYYPTHQLPCKKDVRISIW